MFSCSSVSHNLFRATGRREPDGVVDRMTKAFGIAAIALAMGLGLTAAVALGGGLPSQANPHAVDATSGTHSGADVTGHLNATVNGVPPGPPTWLNGSAPFGPPEWVNTSGGPPTWLTTP